MASPKNTFAAKFTSILAGCHTISIRTNPNATAGGALVKDLLLMVGYPLLRGRGGLHTSYFAALAVRDGLQGRLGKTFAPEDYLR